MSDPRIDANSIKTAFQPAFDEIARRSAVTRSFDPNAAQFFQSSDHVTLPYHLTDQDHILLSFGTAVLAPVPVDSSRPAMRVYGAFQDREEAMEHAQIIQQADPRCSLLIVKRDTWVLLPMTEKVRDDKEESQRRVDAKVEAHRKTKEESDAYFDRVVKERLERPPPKTVPVDEEEIREQEEADALVYKPPRRLRSGVEVRGQAACAVCVIPDELGECVVRVLGCFASAGEAEAWVQNVASRKIIDHDIYVAPTCEWFYPNGFARGAQDRYRQDELQRIMDAAAKNPKAVRDYKEWKKEQDRLSEIERARAAAEAAEEEAKQDEEEANNNKDEPEIVD